MSFSLEYLPRMLLQMLDAYDGRINLKLVSDLEKEGVLFVEDGNHGEYRPLPNEFVEEGVPFVRPPNLVGGRIVLDECQKINDVAFERVRKGIGKGGDIVLTHNATVGRVAITKDTDPVFVTNPQTTVWRSENREELDPQYLYYFMKSTGFQEQLESHKGRNATFDYVSLTKQRSLVIPVLDIVLQRSLGSKLACLDNKIELNRQTNKTLEEMAQAIFKSWFVDFEPTRAKIAAKEEWAKRSLTAKEGENDENAGAIFVERAAMAAIAGLPTVFHEAQAAGAADDQLNKLPPEQFETLKATAALFPDALVDSELGEIPEGWGVKSIDGVVKRLKPKKRYTKKQVESVGSIPVYEQGASILLGYHNDEAGFLASPEAPLFIFGDHTCIVHLSCGSFDISQNVIPLAGKGYPTCWVYYAIQGKQEFQEYRRHWSEFIVKEIVVPLPDVAVVYSVFATSLYKQKEQLIRENSTLEQIRDTLLPKLLSGELSAVPDKESAA